jgi:hypothetical protein
MCKRTSLLESKDAGRYIEAQSATRVTMQNLSLWRSELLLRSEISLVMFPPVGPCSAPERHSARSARLREQGALFCHLQQSGHFSLADALAFSGWSSWHSVMHNFPSDGAKRYWKLKMLRWESLVCRYRVAV